MKKMLLAFALVSASQFAHANYSANEIKAILESERVLNLIQDSQIKSINKAEREFAYSVDFGTCSAIITAMPVCPPGLPPEGEKDPGCAINVQFESSDVTCI